MAGGVTEELAIADCCGCVAGVDRDCFECGFTALVISVSPEDLYSPC